jgi:hypothetical protein
MKINFGTNYRTDDIFRLVENGDAYICESQRRYVLQDSDEVTINCRTHTYKEWKQIVKTYKHSA